MIDIETLFTQVSGLDPDDLERWILNSWVRPAGNADRYEFREIDVARVRLIQELRDELQVNEDAIPVVLSLLDQLHDVPVLHADVSAPTGWMSGLRSWDRRGRGGSRAKPTWLT